MGFCQQAQEQDRLLSEREVKIAVAEEAASRVFVREKALEEREESLQDREVAAHKREMDLQLTQQEVEAFMARQQEESRQLAADRQLLEEDKLALEDAIQVRIVVLFSEMVTPQLVHSFVEPQKPLCLARSSMLEASECISTVQM